MICTCHRCGYEWDHSGDGLPVSCPRYGCRSRQWNEPEAIRATTRKRYPVRPKNSFAKHREPNTLGTLHCERCGYEWEPRDNKLPVTCPHIGCRSRLWQTPRPLKSSPVDEPVVVPSNTIMVVHLRRNGETKHVSYVPVEELIRGY